MFALILILLADDSFAPAPEFLERWVSMPQSTPAERLEREDVRKQWVKALRQKRAAELAYERRERVNIKNSSGYYFWRQHQNNSEVAAGLNSLQPRGYWIIP